MKWCESGPFCSSEAWKTWNTTAIAVRYQILSQQCCNQPWGQMGLTNLTRLTPLAVQYSSCLRCHVSGCQRKFPLWNLPMFGFWLCKGKRDSQKGAATDLSLITSKCRGLMDFAIRLVSSVEWTLLNGLLKNSGVFVLQAAVHQEHTWLHQAEPCTVSKENVLL